MKRAAWVLAVACGGEQHTSATVTATATVTLPPPPTASAAAAPSASEQSVGMIGLLNADPDGPKAPWGSDALDGGNMWDDSTDSFGVGGLGLDGTASVDGGSGRGRLGGNPSHASTIRKGATASTEGLPREVIRRIVRQNYGRYRLCYERGLLKTPALAGTVVAKFTIDPTGAVAKVERGPGTTMPDSAVVDCVLRGFGNLSFPQPTTGAKIVVNYPIRFAPGD